VSAGFVHEDVGSRVVFGAGRVDEAGLEAARLGGRCLVICDEVAVPIAARIEAAFEGEVVGRIEQVRQHVPVADAEAARELARDRGADVLLTVGGGSAVGLGKAIALSDRLPILAVPTTYAGSEMTPVWGMTEDAVKTTGRDPVVAPRTVVYDPELTYSLPPEITAASGLNAVAHCVDALWSGARTPLSDAIAERAVAALAAGLPGAVRDGSDGAARARALIGAWLAGKTFAATGSSLHHKIAHLLGGRYDLPHAPTHAALLPWVAEVALPAVPSAREAISRALGVDDPVAGLRALSRELGAPATLAEIGLSREEAEAAAADLDVENLDAPGGLQADAVRELLIAAATGTAAEAGSRGRSIPPPDDG
jgi:alcohol dehydrogenase class IV